MEECLERIAFLRKLHDEVPPEIFDRAELVVCALYMRIDPQNDLKSQRPSIFVDDDDHRIQFDWIQPPLKFFSMWLFADGRSHFTIGGLIEIPPAVYEPEDLAKLVTPLLLNPPVLKTLIVYYRFNDQEQQDLEHVMMQFKTPLEQYTVQHLLDKFEKECGFTGPLKLYNWCVDTVQAFDPNSPLVYDDGHDVFYVTHSNQSVPDRREGLKVYHSRRHGKLLETSDFCTK